MCTRFSGYIFRTVILFLTHCSLIRRKESSFKNFVWSPPFQQHTTPVCCSVCLEYSFPSCHPRLCPFLMAKGISWRQQINRSCFKIQYAVLFLLIREQRLQVFRIVIERCKLVHVFINFVVVRGFLLLISLTLVPAQFALSCSLMDVFIFLISSKKFSQKFSIEVAWSWIPLVCFLKEIVSLSFNFDRLFFWV